jgi:hypothetical protein
MSLPKASLRTIAIATDHCRRAIVLLSSRSSPRAFDELTRDIPSRRSVAGYVEYEANLCPEYEVLWLWDGAFAYEVWIKGIVYEDLYCGQLFRVLYP